MPPKETSNENILHALLNLHEAVGERFDKVDRQFDDVRSQLARIETVILQDHQRRIEALEHHLSAR